MNKYQLQMLSDDDLLLLRAELNNAIKLKKLDKRRVFINRLRPVDHATPKELRDAVTAQNKNNLLSLPENTPLFVAIRKFLRPLLAQNWSRLFPEGDKTPKYYVYAHVDPSGNVAVLPEALGGNWGGQPFYVGKGCGNRAYDLKRNQGHGKKIGHVLSEGWEPRDIVKIVKDNLAEREAFELEAKLIYFFGSIYEPGRSLACLYNLDLAVRPTFVGEMKEPPTRKQFEKMAKSRSMV